LLRGNKTIDPIKWVQLSLNGISDVLALKPQWNGRCNCLSKWRRIEYSVLYHGMVFICDFL